MTLLQRATLCLAALAIASPAAADVRDFPPTADAYGRGVHAYFAGRTAEAESLFTSALKIRPSDPRIWYFRAMSRLRMGRGDEARSDMATGADLEAERPGRYAVGTALLRVQGSNRLLLEKYRLDARKSAAANRRPPLHQLPDADANVLRTKLVYPLDELLRPGGPRPLSAEEIARRAALLESHRAAAAPVEAAAPDELLDADPFTNDETATPAASGVGADDAESPPEAAESSEPSTEAESEGAPADEEATESGPDPFSEL
jgi:hypothetical protein